MHDYDVKMPTFTIYGNLVPRVRSVGRVGENPGTKLDLWRTKFGGLESKTRIFFFLLVNLETVALEFRLLRISPTFDK